MSYSFFDDIVCINLVTRKDRLRHASDVFHQLGIPARFLNVNKHERGGIYGCFDSHIQVIRSAYDSNKQTLLVFEDDLVPSASYNEQNIKNALSFMKRRTGEWDIFFLGYFITDFAINPVGRFVKAKFVEQNIIEYRPYGCQAYCLSRQGMTKIMASYKKYMDKSIHYDVFLTKKAFLRSFCYIPILFDQKLCFATDNESKNALERNVRRFSCIAEKTNIMYKFSYVKYMMEVYKYIVSIVTIIIFIALYLSHLNKNKFT
jgi:GR25 family glycosyltransferase involved in LPS biosynthesis